MNLEYQQSIYHGNVNANLMKENVIQINGEIMINFWCKYKNNVMYVRKIMFGVLLYVIAEMKNI